MSSVDTYHLTQFVLHVADGVVDDWPCFFAKLVKAYKGHVPNNVLHGLMRKNIHALNTLCKEQFERNEAHAQRIKAKQEEHDLKYKRWIERRNKGNHEAWIRYCDHKKKKAEVTDHRQKEYQQEMLDNYVVSMKHVWEKEFNKIIDKRLQELSDILKR